jgi:chromosome segregation ATPase
MSREGAEHALARLRGEKDRIAAALLDLENHQGYRLLNGARLNGETRRRWDDARARIRSLWGMFDAYRHILDRAERFRSRHARPSRTDLEELTWLLTGPSVELAGEEIPLERRTLLGSTTERLTLEELVARMTRAYEETAETVAAADAAWSALLPRLDEIEQSWRAARGLLRSLESQDRDLDGIGRRLTDLRKAVLADPLSLVRDGRADMALLDRLATDLTARHGELEEAVRIQREYAERTRAVNASIERVRAVEDRAREAREQVLLKIAVVALPHPPELAAALDDRLAALDGLRDEGRWTDLAVRMADLDRAAADALNRAREALQAITGLLDRRNELRGRLEAYRAKAARLGHAEDAELTRLRQRARDLLWEAPCDLREATVAVTSYQRAVGSLRPPAPKDDSDDR